MLIPARRVLVVVFLLSVVAGPAVAQQSVTNENLSETVARIVAAVDAPETRIELGAACLLVLEQAPDAELEREVRMGMGIALSLTDRFEEALEQSKLAGALAEEAKFDDDLAHSLWLQGAAAFNLGQLHDGLKYLEKGLVAAESAQRLDILWRVLNMQGLTLERLGEPESAIASYSRALEATDKSSDAEGKATVLGNLGIVYMNLGEFELAFETFTQAHELFVELGDRSALQTTLANLGDVCINSGRLDDGLRYHIEALELRREFGSEMELARSYHSIGTIYFNLEKYEEALAEFEKALAIRERLSLEPEKVITLSGMALTFAALDRGPEALDHATRGEELSEQLKLKGRRFWVLKTLGGVYESQGLHEEAIDAYLESHEVEKEQRSLEVRRDLAKFKAEFESKEQEQRIALLSREKELQESELTKQRFARNALFVGVVFVSIAAFAGWLAWASLRRATNRIQSLEEERAKAEKLDSLGILAGGIAHDFNNILATVVGNLCMVKQATDSIDPVQASIVDAEHALHKGEQLAGQLLAFAKGGVMKLEVQSLDRLISGPTEQVLANSETTAKIEIDSELWCAEVDAAQIQQLISNVVLNASQASKPGSSIDVSANNVWLDESNQSQLPAGPYLRISIVDHGAGIAPENRDKIFDPYFTTKELGGGLGLSVAYATLKRHNGSIECTSDLGTGTTVEIFIPALPNAVDKPSSSEEVLQNGECRILVMDDEPLLLRLFGRALTSLGHDCTLVEDGEAAIESFRRASEEGSSFDLVILDLTIMGGMGGKETMEQLLEIDPDVHAVVTSGYTDDPVFAHYRDAGFIGALPKPFTLAALSKAVEQVAPIHT